jgi:hypothetical protein
MLMQGSALHIVHKAMRGATQHDAGQLHAQHTANDYLNDTVG